MLAEVRRKQRTLGLKKDQRVPSVCARTHFHHSPWPRGGWRHFNDEAKPSRRTNTSSFLASFLIAYIGCARWQQQASLYQLGQKTKSFDGIWNEDERTPETRICSKFGRQERNLEWKSETKKKRKERKRISAWKQTLHAVKTGYARTLDTGRACVCVVSSDVLYAPSEVIQQFLERSKHSENEHGLTPYCARVTAESRIYLYLYRQKAFPLCFVQIFTEVWRS